MEMGHTRPRWRALVLGVVVNKNFIFQFLTCSIIQWTPILILYNNTCNDSHAIVKSELPISEYCHTGLLHI